MATEEIDLMMTKMKLNTSLAAAVVLCAMAAPGYASTSFAFTVGTAAGTITATNGSLDTLSGVSFTSLQVTDSPLDPTGTLTYNITNGFMNLVTIGSTNYLQLIGTIGLDTASADNLNLTNAVLFQVAVSDTSTSVYSGNHAVLVGVNSAATTITDAALDTALGLTGTLATTQSGIATSGIGGSGSGVLASGAYPFSVSSEALNVVVTQVAPAPEPFSFLLAGGGLLWVGGLARKKHKA